MDTGSPRNYRVAPPPIPVGCICAYTWHSSGDGRSVRNGPLASCTADHTVIDAAARMPQDVRDWAATCFKPPAEEKLTRPAEMFGGKSALEFATEGGDTAEAWNEVMARYETLFSYQIGP